MSLSERPARTGLTPCRPQPRLERTTFYTSRSLDFCNEKGLITETGHERDAWPLVVVKELMDNALDAAEEAGTAPDIKIKVDDIGITVTDNGPGIPAATVKGILDYSIRVSSREAYIAPDRGAQGNALKTLLAMPFVLDPGAGGAVEIVSQGVHHQISFAVDSIRQVPAISHDKNEVHDKNGAEFRLHWPDSACSILHDAKDRFLQIVDDYTWLNPHLTIAVDWFGEKANTPATDPGWRKWWPSDPTCPHWYRPEHLERLIAALIAHNEVINRDCTVREFISEFRGLSGSAKQKKVLDATGLHREPLSRFVVEREIDHGLVASLLVAMQAHSKAVKPLALGLIGREHLEKRFAAAGVDMESFQYHKKAADITDGIPWLVETAFGWCPKAESRRLITGVNWSPGIINPFRQLGAWGESLDTILKEQRASRDEPVILVLHMACPRVEYTDRGKSNVVIE